MPWGDSGGQHPGSSPHTRGALHRADRFDRHCRIIPAYAGSTPLGDHAEVGAEDHPRIRGEHTYGAKKIALRRGSSPHTRGAHRRTERQRARVRIIPAYAGSTRVETGGGQGMSDHPRIRGEHTPSGLRGLDGGGSSPHTRGAREGRAARERRHRIIPAYAGST